MNPSTDDTVALVPLSELIDLANAVRLMRSKQKAFFEQRRANPHTPSTEALHAAKDAERRVDGEVLKILARERRAPSLFEAGG